jgi:hypothetical protein
LQLFLSQQHCGGELADIAQSGDAVIRNRLLGLLVDIADASPQAADLIAAAGALLAVINACYACRNAFVCNTIDLTAPSCPLQGDIIDTPDADIA